MKILDMFLHRRVMRTWRRAAIQAPAMTLGELRQVRAQGRKLGHYINETLAVADSRLALPLVGSNAFPRPHGTDWAWRPEVWRLPLPCPGKASVPSKSMLGREVTVFHDCTRSELSLRQVRNRRAADLAPYGLRMDVFAFDGSFLSLVVDLPQEATEGLTRRHLIRLDTIVEMEKPLEIFARLNIRHGPNTEQIVRELPLKEEEIMVEFDLAYSNLNEKRIERAWIDLIFENPQMSEVILRDVTLGRRPRAAL
ncbi:DUF6478 family protein [Roseovarius autotrophicus]|uniref:DUF6478 family protein n=1 Tax=Roseovarius autotrophicus TaxID=2824121 RepID=UPI0019F3E24D|nr:DUF6478 family protein [Roseovarius autotrophicus]MBE0452659.1 hypothetical protein [Roseovarius sp.]